MNSYFEKIVLLTAGMGVFTIGISYVISPYFLYGLYEISIDSVGQLNMIRGAYSGPFLGFGSLFLIGAFKKKFRFTAVVTMTIFMGGFTFGRLISIILDGMPNAVLTGVFGIEIVYSILGLLMLKRLKYSSNHLMS